MPKNLSLKLDEAIFRESEVVVKRLHIPRNTYINEAIAFYTRMHNRSLLARTLRKESGMVADESMRVLREFEAFSESVE
jgi:hypothetical protein